MHSGVVKGIEYEVKGVINDYKVRFGNLVVVLTGGDVKNFAIDSKNTTFADQNLVLKGLNKILDFYYQKA
jgi:type III pantothenate kinase